MSIPPSEEVSQEARERAEELASTLYPHQVEGVAFLLARRRSILADDMGLGKTRQTIVAMLAAEPEGPWVVVCPASVKLNWVNEVRMVSPEAEIHLVNRKNPPSPHATPCWFILNYDILTKHLPALLKLQPNGIIFDEAHYLKNYKSKRSQAASQFVEKLDHAAVHCLTGTPLMNRPSDLFPLLKLVGHALGKSFLAFAKRYCDAYRGDFGWVTKGASNLEELMVQLHGTMLRRTKEEVLDLPPKQRTWLTVEDPKVTSKRGLRRLLLSLLGDQDDASKSEQKLAPLSRSKLIARLTPIRSEMAGSKISHTVDFAKGVLEQGEKVIIYSCFREVLEAIYAEFEPGMATIMDGSTSTEDRQRAVEAFQNDDSVRVFCATVIAGGIGITLTAARTVIFNDLDWVPANHWQAEDRAYRIGQDYPVNVYYFRLANSIDEFVGRVLEAKSNIIGAVVDADPSQLAAQSTDILAELETALMGLQELSADQSSSLDSQFSDLLSDRIETIQTEAAPATVAGDPLSKASRIDADFVLLLAQALSQSTTSNRKCQMFRVEGSKSKQDYEMTLDGSDVSCSCRGFAYRGQCKHTQTLRTALADGMELPKGYTRVDS